MSSTTSSLKSDRQRGHCTSTRRCWWRTIILQEHTVVPLRSVAYRSVAILRAHRRPPSRSSSTATQPWQMSAVRALLLARVDKVIRGHCRRHLHLTTDSMLLLLLLLLLLVVVYLSATRHTQLQTTCQSIVRLNSPHCLISLMYTCCMSVWNVLHCVSKKAHL